MSASIQTGETVRRLSNVRPGEDLIQGPTVVVPPKHLMAPSGANEIAASMAIARQEVEADSSASSTPDLAPVSVTTVTDRFAFAFDIDGVLIRGGKVIPEAVEAMKILNGQNPYGIKVPYIFVTNGGGKTEQERCLQLSQQLQIEVSPGQFICGHTPMREMAERYSTVLVVGGEGEKCRHIAEGYGFKDVITPGDIIKTDESVAPFRKLTTEEYSHSRKRDFSNTRVEAIFVFADSRDWASDSQLIIDLLTSNGIVFGKRAENFDAAPTVFFAHNDVVWATSHESNRIGMGALRVSVEAMYKAVTGRELETVAFGKPQIGTYEFASRLLAQWRKDSHGIESPPETVYFVGDTPESDIRGTNAFDEHAENSWHSLLVLTGVHPRGAMPRHEPKATADNVLEAVKYAMAREHKKALKEHVSLLDSSAIEDE